MYIHVPLRGALCDVFGLLLFQTQPMTTVGRLRRLIG